MGMKRGRGAAGAPPGVPVLQTSPVVTGTAQRGQTLTCDGGLWSGSPTLTFQWQRDAVDIVGATTSTYALALADVGTSIRCRVSASNGAGASLNNPAASNALGPIGDGIPVNTGAPVISGTATEGQTLTVTSNGTWSNGASSFTYQWRRDGVNIGGATTGTYALVTADVGTTITCAVTGTNAFGSSVAPGISNSKGPISPIVPALSTPTLAFASGYVAGTNPMDWDSTYYNSNPFDAGTGNGDKAEMRFRRNAGAWTVCARQPIDLAALVNGFTWPEFDAITFGAGEYVEVQERMIRYAANVESQVSAWSNTLSDTMSAPTFAPSSLYGVGDVGYAWDTTDLAKIWQSNDGTSPGAFASVVGRLQDISGLNNHLNSVDNATRRPVLQNVSNGLVKFDGVNDCFEVLPCLWAGGAGTVIFAVKGPTQDGKFLFGESNSASSAPVWAPGLRSNVGMDVLFYHRNDANAATAVNKDINVFDDTLKVYAITDDGATITFYVNGVSVATHAYTSRAALGATTINKAYLGNVLVAGLDYDVSTSAYIGSGLVIDRALTAGELTSITNWVKGKHGIP